MFWGDGQNQLEEMLAGITGEALIEARNHSGGDAGRAIDMLLGETRDEVRLRLISCQNDPSWQPTPRASLAFIHLMSLEYIRRAGLVRRVTDMLNSIENGLELEEEMSSYIAERAKMIIRRSAEAALMQGAAITKLLNGSHYRVVDGDVVMTLDVRVALDAVLTALSGDGRALWEFRNAVSAGRDELDRAVVAHWSKLSRAVSDATLGLFRCRLPMPSNFLEAFPAAFDDPALLERIIDELAWRQGLHDGFATDAAAAEWLNIIAGFRAWTPNHLRKLLLLEELLRAESAAMLAAIRVGVDRLWDDHRAEAVYGALSLLRHARRLKECRRLVADADEERTCLEFVRSLADGEGVVAVRDRWESLPLVPCGAPRTWDLLSDQAKDVWRARLSSYLKGRTCLAKGVIEFALSWAPKNVFADLEPLLIPLIKDLGAHEHLEVIASSGEGVAALRADALLLHLRLGQPS